MEKGWSASSESPPSNVAGVLDKLHRLGFCSHVDASDDETSETAGDKLCLFDRILKVFMQEVDRWEIALPLPVLLGPGQSVDLFGLYQAVGEKGGFLSVSADNSWGSVAEEIGFESDAGPSLKLVYFKYLGGLNPSLRKVLEEKFSRSKQSLSSSIAQEKNFVPPALLGGGEFLNRLQEAALASPALTPLKRRRDSMVDMLDWVLRVAKNPLLPLARLTSPEKHPKDEDHRVAELMSQALTVRKLMFSKNQDTPLLQKKRKVLLSFYEDDKGLDTKEKKNLRISSRIQSCIKNSLSGPYSGGTPILDKSMDNDLTVIATEEKRERRSLRSSVLLNNMAAGLAQTKRVPIGLDFQAQVPEWTGRTSADSDEQKWLGTRIWPLENGKEPIQVSFGKGRDNHCACEHPGSVECIRFHVGKKRFQLKLELGPAFDDWGFNSMGEEVSFSWAEEEQRRFKSIVRLNLPCQQKDFWNVLNLCFPSKGRQNLVSYYFNVFLLRRRSYQNRVTPNTIESDDEDSDTGFLIRPYSQDEFKIQDPKPVLCGFNTHVMDLSDYSDTDE